jgi:hypothetical protein
MPDDLRELWQEQETEKVTITLDEIRREAWKFERRVHRQNVRGYLFGGLELIFLMWMMGRIPGWRRTPVALCVAGLMCVLWECRRRMTTGTLPADSGLQASLQFYRRQLERQRDGLRTIWAWGFLPVVPGLVAVYAVVGFGRGIDYLLIRGTAAIATVLVGIWVWNLRQVRRLDERISELKALEGDSQ